MIQRSSLFAWLLVALAGTSAFADVGTAARRCREGDAQSCREQALAELSKARLFRALEYLTRGCELGDQESCEDAISIASSMGDEDRAWTLRKLAREVAERPRVVVVVDAGVAEADAGADRSTGSRRTLTSPDLGVVLSPSPADADGGLATDAGRDGGAGSAPFAQHDGLGDGGVERRAAAFPGELTPPPGPVAPAPEEETRPAITKTMRSARINECISAEEKARVAEVRRARGDPTGFQPSGIWLPPVYMTDAERSYTWAGLFYFEVSDFDVETKTRALPPLVVSLCTPESQTLVTPLFGYRRDVEGTAGLALAYFWRRDHLAESDVLFPFFWSFRSRESEETDFTRSSGAVAPFAWWGRDETQGSHYTVVAPLYFEFANREEQTQIVGTYFRQTRKDGWDSGVAPFWFGGERGQWRYDLVPPLLLYRSVDPETTTLFALQTYYQARKDGFTLASVPFVFASREGREHHLLIPPLLTYHSGDDETETTVVLNTYYQSRPNGFSLGLIPFAFLKRDPDSQYTILAPLFWNWWDKEGSTTIVANTFLAQRQSGYDFGVVPLYFRGRHGEREYDLVPPFLFYRGRDAEAETWFALQTYYQSRRDGFTLASVPFVFTGRDATSHYTLIPPLLTYHSGEGDRETTFAVNTFYESRKDGFTLGSFPFVFTRREGAEHSTLIPLLLTYHSGDADKETTLVANTYVQTRRDGFTLAVAPLLFAGRSGEEHHTFVPPLFWRWGDAQTTTTIAANLFYRSREDGYSAGLVPFYFTGRSGESRYDLVPPLLLYRSEDPDKTTWFALQTYYQSRQDGFTLASVPFVFASREGSSHSTFVPALLTYHSGDGATETTYSVNTYYQGREDGFTLASVPFLFTGREGSSHYTLIPPLLTWHSGDGLTETTFALNTYYQGRKDGFTLASVPFLFAGREQQSHYTFVPPLLWRWGDAEQTTTIAANVYYRSTPTSSDLGVVPFYFRGRDADGYYDFAPPFVWSWGDSADKTLIAGPYFKHTDDEGFVAGVVPFWIGAEKNGRRFDLIPPLLLLRARDTDGTAYWAFQTYYLSKPDGFSLASIPFVFAGRDGASHYTFVPLGLTFHWGDGEKESTYAVNTYYQGRPDGFTLASVPFLFMGRDPDSHYTFVPPLFWRWGDADSTTTIAANVFYRRTDARYDLGVVPFYFGGREGERTYDLVPPLLLYRGHDSESTVWWALQTYYESRANGFSLASIPFVFAGREGDQHHALIPPLLTWHSGDGETETTFAVNTYYQGRKDGFTLASVPFLFMGRSPDSHYTLVPPLFWRWGDEEAVTTIAATAFHRKTKERTDYGVAPFYFHGEEGSSHYTVVPPVLAYHSGDGETETTFAVNTFYQSRKEGFTFAFAPLVFAGREKDEHHTVVPPFFWNFADAHEGTTVALPYFKTWKDEDYDLGVVPFYFRGRGGKKAYDLVPPLLFYRGTNGFDTTTFAVNTYYQSRPNGYTLASVPFVFAGEDFDKWHFHIPPLLFFRWGDEFETNTLFANFYLSTSKTEWDASFFPLYFGGRDDKDGSYYNFVPPLFMSWGDDEKNTTIAGTYFKREDKAGFVAGLLPLWIGGRHGNDQWDVVPPLFYRHTSDERTRVTLLPLFDYLRTRDELQILSPLFIHSRTPERERTVALGLYWRFNGPDTDARVVFPFWWDFKSRQTDTRLSTVFPFYWRYEKSDETTHLFLNVMYSSGKTALGPSWSFHFFPFVDLASYNPDHFLWQVFAGLVGGERQGNMRRYRVAYVWTEPTRGPER